MLNHYYEIKEPYATEYLFNFYKCKTVLKENLPDQSEQTMIFYGFESFIFNKETNKFKHACNFWKWEKKCTFRNKVICTDCNEVVLNKKDLSILKTLFRLQGTCEQMENYLNTLNFKNVDTLQSI